MGSVLFNSVLQFEFDYFRINNENETNAEKLLNILLYINILLLHIHKAKSETI